MLHPRRERLADLAKHFGAESSLWPDLRHSLVIAQDPQVPELTINRAWAMRMGYSPAEASAEVRLKAIIPSVDDLTVACHHFFVGGGGIEAYSTLARLMMTEIWEGRYEKGNGRIYAPFHWIEVVHKACSFVQPDDERFVAKWSAPKLNLDMSLLTLDVFTACQFATDYIAEGLFPLPPALGKWGQRILDALDGNAMTADQLVRAIRIDRSDLIGEYIGPKGCLRVAGLVVNKRRLGYYRPDAPPPRLGEKNGKTP